MPCEDNALVTRQEGDLDGDHSRLCGVDGQAAEKFEDDTLVDPGGSVNDKHNAGVAADAVPLTAAASEPLDVAGGVASCAGGENSEVGEAVRPLSDAVDEVQLDHPATTASVTPAVSDNTDARAAARPSDALSIARTDPGDRSSTIGGGRPATARHSLPSALAAAPPPGKHRLPPVLTPTSGHAHAAHGHGQTSSHGGLERVSPLSLVVGGGADSVPRGSASLTGGTRLGDLGLSHPQPTPPAPALNLSLSEQAGAVNMKVASQRSPAAASDAASCTAAGTFVSIACMPSALSYFRSSVIILPLTAKSVNSQRLKVV